MVKNYTKLSLGRFFFIVLKKGVHITRSRKDEGKLDLVSGL